ncbi:MAG: DUF1971 domain-containing protein [Hyphomicrobiaceae bacterium]
MTRIASQLPPGLTCYRRTSEFTRNNVPSALLGTHTTKAGVWGVLRVLRGRVRYCLDGTIPKAVVIGHDGAVVIAPEAPHHVELLDEESAFLVEFYRAEKAP